MRSSMKKGFTLIELLIVVVIIGILAAVAIPKFSNTKQRASRSAGIADMRNLATAQEGFFADSSRYALIADTGTGAGKMNFTPSNGNTALTLVATATGWSGDQRQRRVAVRRREIHLARACSGIRDGGVTARIGEEEIGRASCRERV